MKREVGNFFIASLPLAYFYGKYTAGISALVIS